MSDFQSPVAQKAPMRQPKILVAWALIAANAIALMIVVVLSDNIGTAVGILVLASFTVVGAVLVLKQPTNLEAWLLLVIGTAWSTSFLLPFDGGWVPPVGLMGTQLLLRFPNGQLPSPRWRWFSRASIVLIVILSFVVSCADRLTENGVINEYYVSWAHWIAGIILLQPIFIGVSVWSLVVRFRRADLAEREQIRWLAWAAGTVALTYAVALLSSINTSWGGDDAGTLLSTLQSAALLSFGLIPLAIGVAVLKYRLYEIDRIISRGASYLIVSGLILCTYLVVVTLVLQLHISSSLAVAVATLTAAATARPFLRRIQGGVDRRFNRAKYNAEQTVERFGVRLREVADPALVATDLVSVVGETLEPAHVRLWIVGRS